MTKKKNGSLTRCIEIKSRLMDLPFFLSLYTSEYQKDPVAVMQFGLAILKDKPIYILCHKGQQLCENVKRVAKHIEYFDPDDIDDLKKKTEIIVEKAQKDVINAK